jgi:pSer/pThr/pTyr-binding forkhead associated (FHA) protein
MGTADTDPSGRPVATAAQVAALSQQAAYGKLVVISSNYAGKEFDLTRPQMIVGRTDENDIVVNHRSISRNHAKVTRDPETGRYTISDLQSSNGVRVNGQDYGKVELRRADVIDLGHVRLRFVEPGEDFVFSRDAVITDVPESSGRRGLLLVVALGVLLLTGVAVFIMLNSNKGGGGGGEGPKTDNGSSLANNVGPTVASGSDLGSNEPAVGSAVGSGSAVVVVPLPDAAAEAPPTTNPGEEIRIECYDYKTQKNWQELTNCSDKLAQYDAKSAAELKKKAKAEMGNQLAAMSLEEAIRKNDPVAAKKHFDLIDDDSIYHKTAQDHYQQFEASVVALYRSEAILLKNKHNCSALEGLATKADKVSAKAADVVRQMHCEPATSATNPDHVKVPAGSGSGSATQAVPPTPPPTTCDADALEAKGATDTGAGHYPEALATYEQLYQCKGSPHAAQLAFMASCNQGNVPKAKKYYKKLSTDAQTRFVQICIRRNITKEQLDAP